MPPRKRTKPPVSPESASTFASGDELMLDGLTTSVSAKVAKAGDTMTGDLTLADDPSSALHAATKQYVDLRHQAFLWNGSSYVPVSNVGIYVGPSDPGAVADGSVWLDTS